MADDYDPYQEYMAQSPMAATPYLPYDSGQGGQAVDPSAAPPIPVPNGPTGGAPDVSGLNFDIGDTLSQVTKNLPNGIDTPLVHKGLFGIHGTLRDVLGFLGDTLTGKPLYGQARDEEAKSDALKGFQTDPEGAIDRMAEADPDTAIAMRNSLASRQEREAAARTTAARAEAYQAQVKQAVEDKVLQRAAGVIRLAQRTYLPDGKTVDPDNMKRATAAVTNLLKAKDITLPDGMTVADLPGYSTAAKDQNMEDYRGDVNDIRWANSDERGRHNVVTEGQGAARVQQGEARVQQGNRRLDQGDTRLGQQGQHYQNQDAAAAVRAGNDTTRTGWGPRNGRRGVASIPTFSADTPEARAAFAKLPNNAPYIDPNGNLKHKGVK